jgi:hypothetical protein
MYACSSRPASTQAVICGWGYDANGVQGRYKKTERVCQLVIATVALMRTVAVEIRQRYAVVTPQKAAASIAALDVGCTHGLHLGEALADGLDTEGRRDLVG